MFKNKNSKLTQLTLFAYFVLCGALVFFLTNYFFSVLFESDSWNLADWLINYEAGFIRRGLIGQLIIFIADFFSINIKWLSFTLQAMTWISIYYLTSRIYSLRRREKEWLLLLLSPAFLLFPFFDVGAGLRKEIILFLSFAVLAYGYAKQELSKPAVLISYILFVVASFSHELATLATVFFVFVFFKLYQQALLTKKQLLWYSALFILTAFIAGLSAIIFKGDKYIADAICRSLTSRGLNDHICTGAIRWLSYDSKQTLEFMSEEIFGRKFRYFVRYPVTILLAITPLFFIRPFTRLNISFFILSFICFLPLYPIAKDWYRWIYIYTTLTFLFILADSITHNYSLKRIHGFWIFLYLTIWSVHSTSGWFSFFRYLIVNPEKVFSF